MTTADLASARDAAFVAVMKERLVAMRRDLANESDADARELATPASDRGEDTTPSQHPADVASELEARPQAARDIECLRRARLAQRGR